MCYNVARMKKFSLGTFLLKYRNDDDCLEHIIDIRYPQGIYCEKHKMISKFYKVKDRPVYQCSCGYQISPLAGTIFEKTTTPLQYWFYAMFIMTATRSGVSAKQLQRELGITYKTAWRMMKQIRILMANVDKNLLNGIVEINETFIGGKGKNRAYQWREGVEGKEKEIVMGMVERQGRAYLKHIPNTGKFTLLQQIKENVDPTARIMTDELASYINLPKLGYFHQAVKHSKYEYVRGEVHTQNIENVWSHVKRGIYGVYRVVSKKYLQSYIDEYSWRYNRRKSPVMFDLLLAEVGQVKAIK